MSVADLAAVLAGRAGSVVDYGHARQAGLWVCDGVVVGLAGLGDTTGLDELLDIQATAITAKGTT